MAAFFFLNMQPPPFCHPRIHLSHSQLGYPRVCSPSREGDPILRGVFSTLSPFPRPLLSGFLPWFSSWFSSLVFFFGSLLALRPLAFRPGSRASPLLGSFLRGHPHIRVYNRDSKPRPILSGYSSWFKAS